MIDETQRQKSLQRGTKPGKKGFPIRQKAGHGWPVTITISLITFAIGIAGGLTAGGALQVVTAYDLQRAAHDGQKIDRNKPATKADAAPAFYPDNNKLEWSTSLSPGETPAPLDVTNASLTNNQRLLFYAVENNNPRLAATLYVRAGHRALINLPVGQYRVDVASSATTLPWDKAQNLVAIPAYALNLPADDQENVPNNRLVISEDGKVGFSRLDYNSTKGPEKNAATADEPSNSSKNADGTLDPADAAT